MAKPLIVANGGTAGVKASVSASATITLTLDSIVGVRSVQWIVLSTDETSSVGDYTIVQSGSLGQTATTTALTAGTAVLFKVIVNSGLVRGYPDAANTSNTIKVFVPTTDGLEVGAAGETYESDSTYGTTEILNQPIRVLNTFTLSLYENDLKRAIASTITNVAITGDPSPMDGVTILTGDVVLLTGQSTIHQNGLWVVNTAGAWTRPANFNSTVAVQGAIVAVVKGTTRAGYLYQCTNVNDPVVGSTSLTFARVTDKYDRADLALASATPAVGALARYGSTAELNGAFFQSNAVGTKPSSGLVRGIDGTVFLASRNDANTQDVAFVSWGVSAADALDIGSSSAATVNLSVAAGGECAWLDDGSDFVGLSKSRGFVFIDGANMSFSVFGTAAVTGAVSTIEAQAGATTGGLLLLRSGNGATAGNLQLDCRSTGNISLNSNVNSYGSGQRVIYIANATTVPTTDPTGGGILYCEAGALKFRGSSGTISSIAPA